MRLIDADALLEKYAGWVNVYSPKPGGKESLRVVTTQEIRNMPTIDAIPVGWIRAQVDNEKRAPLFRRYAEALLTIWQMEQEAQDGKA